MDLFRVMFCMFWMNSAVFLSNYSEKLIIVEVSQSFQIFKFTTVSHCPSKVFSQKKSLYRNNFASFNSKLHLHLPLHSLSCSRAISGIGLGSMEMSVHTDSMSTFGTKKRCSNGILPSGVGGLKSYLAEFHLNITFSQQGIP